MELTVIEEDYSQQFSSLRNEHKELYGEIREGVDLLNQEATAGAAQKKNRWDNEIKILIERIKKFAPNATGEDEVAWVRDAAFEWDSLLPYISDESRDVCEEIESLLPAKIVAPRNISEDYLKRFSHSLSEARKSRWIDEHWHIVYQLIPSTSEEIKRDWYDACTYFASKTLNGKISLALQVHPDLFNSLEGVWLEYLKQVEAYHIWLNNGDGYNSEELRNSYYRQACEQISVSLYDAYLRANLSLFEALEDYLKKTKEYLNGNNKLSRNQYGELIKGAKELVAIKAYQLGVRIGRNDRFQNWLSAEQYVTNFYENIVSAVKHGDSESLEKVKKAINCELDPDHKYIINCFEAALVVYFIKAEDLQGVRF